MTGVIWIVATVVVLFTVGYIGYGRYLSRFVELDDSRETPAHKYQDGQEYVPAKKPVLLGHHFSSVAGGAPIAGPVTAALVWGWLPALLWVAIGNPLMGAVHDFMALSSSIRHEGKSIGFVIGEYIGERGKNMFLWFAFLVIILVVAVFSLLVAVILDAYPPAATASLLYITLALFAGVWLYQLNLSFIGGTVLFVLGVFASIWAGIQFPIALFEPSGFAGDTTVLLPAELASWVPGEALFGANTAAWILVSLGYAFVASILPVWILLQPRDYLSSFLLYAGVGGAITAVFVGTAFGTSDEPLTAELPAYTSFMGGDLAPAAMPLFPLLFITIACGTISGFHSLVSSGTTAKQLNKESDARLIGYGGMLAEGLLAATALAAVSVVAITDVDDIGGIDAALPNFAEGGGLILTSLGIPFEYGEIFMALVFVSFLLTSLDTGLRLGRYMIEELVGTPETGVEETAANKYVNTGLATFAAFLLVSSGQWEELWPLFGGANQLLAALALLTATIWLANWKDTKQLLSTGIPVVVMTAITIIGLLWLVVYENLYTMFLDADARADATILELVSSGLRMAIALVLIWLAIAIIRLGYANLQEQRDDLLDSDPGSQAPGADDD
ncbi:carbon starvation CstA family protein [Natronorubrum daqingense]|uniref:Carbon starvation protein n=1 Tax=Natronorubrum daqingense TaxID=588898 RepID=A0A1N7CHZ5_9EURY|nr:carbon starvation protein A [Natronorubrum daqingense]APX96915.1 carbon starvation protein A [Natronorubrum daqingense]SIR63195.1 carbon starvation protein [Natronorubrum daqingense]